MRLTEVCEHCGYELTLDEKDIIELTENDKKSIKIRNKRVDELRKEKINTLFGKKQRYSENTLNLMRIRAFAKYRCFCGSTSYLMMEK